MMLPFVCSTWGFGLVGNVVDILRYSSLDFWASGHLSPFSIIEGSAVVHLHLVVYYPRNSSPPSFGRTAWKSSLMSNFQAGISTALWLRHTLMFANGSVSLSYATEPFLLSQLSAIDNVAWGLIDSIFSTHKLTQLHSLIAWPVRVLLFPELVLQSDLTKPKERL